MLEDGGCERVALGDRTTPYFERLLTQAQAITRCISLCEDLGQKSLYDPVLPRLRASVHEALRLLTRPEQEQALSLDRETQNYHLHARHTFLFAATTILQWERHLEHFHAFILEECNTPEKAYRALHQKLVELGIYELSREDILHTLLQPFSVTFIIKPSALQKILEKTPHHRLTLGARLSESPFILIARTEKSTEEATLAHEQAHVFLSKASPYGDTKQVPTWEHDIGPKINKLFLGLASSEDRHYLKTLPSTVLFHLHEEFLAELAHIKTLPLERLTDVSWATAENDLLTIHRHVLQLQKVYARANSAIPPECARFIQAWNYVVNRFREAKKALLTELRRAYWIGGDAKNVVYACALLLPLHHYAKRIPTIMEMLYKASYQQAKDQEQLSRMIQEDHIELFEVINLFFTKHAFQETIPFPWERLLVKHRSHILSCWRMSLGSATINQQRFEDIYRKMLSWKTCDNTSQRSPAEIFRTIFINDKKLRASSF